MVDLRRRAEPLGEVRIRLQRTHFQSHQGVVAQGPYHEAAQDLRMERGAGPLQD